MSDLEARLADAYSRAADEGNLRPQLEAYAKRGSATDTEARLAEIEDRVRRLPAYTQDEAWLLSLIRELQAEIELAKAGHEMAAESVLRLRHELVVSESHNQTRANVIRELAAVRDAAESREKKYREALEKIAVVEPPTTFAHHIARSALADSTPLAEEGRTT